MSFDKQSLKAFRQRFAQRFFTLNWITALWSVALFFVFPLPAILNFTDLQPPVSHIATTIRSVAEDQVRVASVFSIIMAALTTSAFNYLNSKTQLDFFHSQPVSRKELFFKNYFAGWLSFAAPLTIAVFLEAAIICLFNGFLVQPLLTVLRGYIGCILVYFAVNALFTLAVMLCGKRITALLTGIFLCITPYAIVYIIGEYFFMMSETYTSIYVTSFEMINSCFHPFVSVYEVFSNSHGITELFSPPNMQGSVWMQVMWAILSAAIVIISLWLYTRRKSEDAGKAFIYPKVIPFIRYPVIIFFAWYGGIIFEEYADGYFWKIFGICISGIVSFFVFSFIEKRGFRNALRSWWRLLISAGVYIGCVLLIFACALLFDTKTAENKDIVAIDVNHIYYQEYYYLGDEYEYPAHAWQEEGAFTVSDPENIKAVNKLIKNCVKATSENDVYVDDKLNDEEFSAGARLQMLVKIYTKNGSFERTYGIYCNADGETEELINKFAYSLEATLTKETRLFASIDPAAEDFKFNSCSYQYNSNEYTLSAEKTKLLYEAIKKDLEEAVPSDYEERPMNCVQIYYSFTDSNNEQHNASVTETINIYESYKNALAVLGEGFKSNPWIGWWRYIGKFDGNANDGKASLASETEAYKIGREIGKYYGERDAKNQSGYTEPETDKAGHNNYTDAFNEGLQKGYDEAYAEIGDAFTPGYEEGYQYGLKIGANYAEYEKGAEPPEREKPQTEFRKGYNQGFIDGFKDAYDANT